MENNQEITRAAEYAAEAHKGQQYGDGPYTIHLEQVDLVLVHYGFRSNVAIRQAGLLHDVIEDTDKDKLDIVANFGDVVADLVYAVTNEPGANRKERQLATYPKIRAVENAIIVKLADRLANVQFSLQAAEDKRNKSLFGMYKKEYPGFREALYKKCKTFNATPLVQMWARLDDLLGDK